MQARQTYSVLKLLIQVLDDSSETARGLVEVVVEALPGLVVAVVVLGFRGQLVLDQGQDFGGME